MIEKDMQRKAALLLLSNGSATMAEVAELAGVTRQAVRYWVDRNKINPHKARKKRVRQLWMELLEAMMKVRP